MWLIMFKKLMSVSIAFYIEGSSFKSFLRISADFAYVALCSITFAQHPYQRSIKLNQYQRAEKSIQKSAEHLIFLVMLVKYKLFVFKLLFSELKTVQSHKKLFWKLIWLEKSKNLKKKLAMSNQKSQTKAKNFEETFKVNFNQEYRYIFKLHFFPC